LYWQFFDYYYAPNGSFYGAKNACEPVHIQYSYADSSIYVVNGLYKDFNNLKASLKLYDFNMKERLSKEAEVNIGADGIKKVISFEKPQNLTNVYFLKLGLTDDSGREISSNFYWLSLKGDEKADFTDLNKLKKVDLKYYVSSPKKDGNKSILTLNIENPSSTLAFSVNPKIIRGNSRDLVTPIFWEDNYFSMLPGEKRTISVQFDPKQLDGEDPMLEIEGWNINKISSKIQ
jgi:exo-1,4-beta-D-glucosaminidase